MKDYEEFWFSFINEVTPFQKYVKRTHNKNKKKLVGTGKNKKKSHKDITFGPYERSKSAPPGFGVLEVQEPEEQEIFSTLKNLIRKWQNYDKANEEK